LRAADRPETALVVLDAHDDFEDCEELIHGSTLGGPARVGADG
jgi:hypothetical protein